VLTFLKYLHMKNNLALSAMLYCRHTLCLIHNWSQIDLIAKLIFVEKFDWRGKFIVLV